MSKLPKVAHAKRSANAPNGASQRAAAPKTNPSIPYKARPVSTAKSAPVSPPAAVIPPVKAPSKPTAVPSAPKAPKAPGSGGFDMHDSMGGLDHIGVGHSSKDH